MLECHYCKADGGTLRKTPLASCQSCGGIGGYIIMFENEKAFLQALNRRYLLKKVEELNDRTNN